MSIRPIVTLSDPLLYKISEPVEMFDHELRNLVRDMFDTMYSETGIGLAAVQIAVLKRVLVLDLESLGFSKGVFINPSIIEESEKFTSEEEGCLSIPGIVAPVSRSEWIILEYQDITAKKHTIKAEDFFARALLHEIDHLNGQVYTNLLEEKYLKRIEKDLNSLMRGEALKNPVEPAYRKR